MKSAMVVCLFLSVIGASWGSDPPPPALLQMIANAGPPEFKRMVTLACLKVLKEKDLMMDLFDEQFPNFCSDPPPPTKKGGNLASLLRSLVSRKKREIDDDKIVQGCRPFIFGPPPPEPQPQP